MKKLNLCIHVGGEKLERERLATMHTPVNGNAADADIIQELSNDDPDITRTD